MGFLKGKEMTGKSNIIPSLNFGPEHNWRRRKEEKKGKKNNKQLFI